ncbi:GNAT family N-acetyltransferase [Streptomyces sp. NBC_00047]|uniref:GNAT family N-acetyltransferase n=1 Tax=Streptomyces sp. NBC_00047 TaxID=2975627 RepID=UPI00225256D6|nr:GNAT family N-acetyltransferase [Streptomyces sp. NBC_00047]MCX5606637.1 GNAT family N-acetyltransferase [Streptomyces sp. NBC_00047]
MLTARPPPDQPRSPSGYLRNDLAAPDLPAPLPARGGRTAAAHLGDDPHRADHLGRPRLFSWPLDDAQLAAYAADPGRHIWTAVSPGNHRVGHVSVSGTRLGRVLIAPEARDQGLGRALVSQAVELCFGELALPEITLGVWAHNTAALRIYEKLGFRTEEILEGVEEVDGVPWTAVQMRLTAPDR